MKSSVLAFQYANKKNETLLLSLLKMAREQGINPEFYCEVIGLIQKLFYNKRFRDRYDFYTYSIAHPNPNFLSFVSARYSCPTALHARDMLLQSSSFKGRFFFGCVVLLLL